MTLIICTNGLVIFHYYYEPKLFMLFFDRNSIKTSDAMIKLFPVYTMNKIKTVRVYVIFTQTMFYKNFPHKKTTFIEIFYNSVIYTHIFSN